MPERPACSACQNSPLLWPSAEMTPRPVTATRRACQALSRRLSPLAVRLGSPRELRDAVDHIANRTQILRGIVRNIDIEFALHREKDVDAVQRIDAELLKGAVGA